MATARMRFFTIPSLCKLKLRRMAEESGIATASANDLIRFGRARKGKKLSNDDWASPVDPDARIAKIKDGTTHLPRHRYG